MPILRPWRSWKWRRRSDASAKLADARERGEPFERAWLLGLHAVCPSAGLYLILQETQETWQRAYDREPPSRAEQAAGELFGVLDTAA